MSATETVLPPQKPWLAAAALAAALVSLQVGTIAAEKLTLFALGLGLGIALYHASFGFTGAYRRLFLDRDLSGLAAQLVMVAVATAMFAPMLAAGEAFGRPVAGAVAPVGVAMVLGAFVFGIGMQLGGGCGSGTLFAVGGGHPRMLVTLAFFCVGGFWASLDLGWWRTLPEMPALALGRAVGYGPALGIQLVFLAAVYAGLRAWGGYGPVRLWSAEALSARSLWRGPWPLLLGALVLAGLNAATLMTAGHPWSITWGFTLWGAKAAAALGWDPATSAFWRGDFQARALTEPVLADTTSLMNVGIVVGALAAAALAGRIAPRLTLAPRPLLAAAIGGLMMGYGARLAYGCNIGAFFSGAASTSLHGWVWLLAALAGNGLGVWLRPWFRLEAAKEPRSS